MKVTAALIWHDPARAVLPRALFTCLAVGLLLRAVPDFQGDITRLDADHLPGGFAPMYLLLTAMVAVFVLSAAPWTRCSRLALGLPLTSRKVWLVRTTWLVGIALVSVTALGAVLGLSFGPADAALSMNGVILQAGVRAAVTVILLLFLFQLPSSELYSIPITADYVVYSIFIGVLALVVSAIGLPSRAGSLVLLAVAAAVGAWLSRQLPQAFAVGPTLPASDAPGAAGLGDASVRPHDGALAPAAADAQVPRRLLLHRTLFRTLNNNLLSWVLLVGFAASAAVVVAEFFDGANAFLPIAFIVAWHLPVMHSALERMGPFDHLPIARRLLWAHTAVPFMIATALGALFVFAQVWIDPLSWTQVSFKKCCVRVPWEYLALTRDNAAPTVTTPWGESYTPRLQPLWRGSVVALYDPYEVGPESSPRFVELQLQRAVEAVYGVPIPLDVLDAAHHASDDVEQSVSTVDQIRGRSAPERNRSAAVAVLLATALSTTLVMVNLLRIGGPRHRKVFTWASTGCLIVLGMVVAAFVVARLAGLVETWHLGALMSIGIRSLSHRLPISTPAVWLVTVTFWALSHLLIERVFQRIELPTRRIMNRFAEEY